MFEILFLILGLFGLVLGTELIIRGIVNIAEHFKISQLFLGLTVVAIGTDLPELVIAINGAIHKLLGVDTSGLVIGQAIGSSFGQIALTLGIIGLFASLALTKRELFRDGLMMVASVILLFLVSFDGQISRLEGIIFILIYVFYFLALLREERVYEKLKRAPPMQLTWDIVSVVGGFAILIYSSNIVIENAVLLADTIGITQSIVGSLIIGLGTSLPELAVSIQAIRKKAIRLSIGNLFGSNIFDVLFVLGASSTISEFNVASNLLVFDIPFLFFTSLLVVLLFGKRLRLGRKKSWILILVYLIYAAAKLSGI